MKAATLIRSNDGRQFRILHKILVGQFFWSTFVGVEEPSVQNIPMSLNVYIFHLFFIVLAIIIHIEKINFTDLIRNVAEVSTVYRRSHISKCRSYTYNIHTRISRPVYPTNEFHLKCMYRMYDVGIRWVEWGWWVMTMNRFLLRHVSYCRLINVNFNA